MKGILTTLALLAPLAASATARADIAAARVPAQLVQYPAPYSPSQPGPYWGPTAPQRSTRVWVIPPRRGTVFLYDGNRVIASFDRPTSLDLTEGRSYGAVSTHGRRMLWSGQFATTPGTMVLRFSDNRGPTIDRIPPGYGPGYGPAPNYGPGYGPGYGPAPNYGPGYGPGYSPAPAGGRVAIGWDLFNSLILVLDQGFDEPYRLAYVSGVLAQNNLSVGQVGQVLSRIPSERGRLQALGALRLTLVDPQNRQQLLPLFGSPGGQREAAGLLGL